MRPLGVPIKAIGQVSICLLRCGCTNRPFYRLIVAPDVKHYGRLSEQSVLEQLGQFDPIPNWRNEKLVSLNLERISYWMARNAYVTKTAGQLLGLAGFLPIHPVTYIEARKARQAARSKEEEAQATA